MQDDFGNQIPTLPQMWRRMDEFQVELKANTEATTRIETNTSELIGILNSFKGAFKVLTWIGKLAKPFAAIFALAAAIFTLVTAIKGGVSPK